MRSSLSRRRTKSHPNPKAVNYAEAAAVPAAGSTAWQVLVDVAKLGAGQTVLIHGGSGGVGHLAIQIAKARGAKVIATASTANQDFIKKMGTDVTVDYTKTRFEEVWTFISGNHLAASTRFPWA